MATRPVHGDPDASEPAASAPRTEPVDPTRSAPWRKSRRSPAGPGTACVEGTAAIAWTNGSVTRQQGGAPIFLRTATPEAAAASAPAVARDTPKAVPVPVPVTAAVIEPPRTEAIARPAAWQRGSRDATDTAGAVITGTADSMVTTSAVTTVTPVTTTGRAGGGRTGLVGVGFGIDVDSDISASGGEPVFAEPSGETERAAEPALAVASVRSGVGFDVPATDHPDLSDRLDPLAQELPQAPYPAIVETSPEGEPTLLLSAGGNEPPPVTRLRVPSDTVLHAEAAAAIPRAVGWKTLLAHSSYGAEVDGERPLAVVEGEHDLTPAELAGRLQAADGGFEGVVMIVCDAAADPENGPAAALHAETGGTFPILAPTREAIMSPDGDGDVLSGTWRGDDAGGFEPVPVGGWVLFKDGKSTRYDTASLRQALDEIGVEAVSGGRPPEKAVSFIAGLTYTQRRTLDDLGYRVPDEELQTEATHDSFYRALIRTGAVNATVEGLRDAIATNVGAQWEARYGNLALRGRSVEDVVALLRDPNQWTLQHDLIVPHAAADLLGLELGVVGVMGYPEAVGDAGRDRRGDANADPFILVRLSDRYVRAQLIPGQSPRLPRELQPPRELGDPNPWTSPLTRDELRRIEQTVRTAPIPQDVVQRGVADFYQGMRDSAFANPSAQVDRDERAAERDRISEEYETHLVDAVLPGNEGARSAAISALLAAERLRHAYSTMDAEIGSFRTWLEQRLLQAPGPAPAATIARRAQVAAHALTEARFFGRVRDARNNGAAVPGPEPIEALIRRVRNHADANADSSDPEAFGAAVNAALDDPGIREHLDELMASVVRYDEADRYVGANLVPDARRVADSAESEVVEAYIDQVRAEVKPVVAWHIRQDNALADLWVARPDRSVPRGFGQRGPDGRRQYPMGRAGRFVRLGNVRVSDHGGVADLLAQLALNGLRHGRPEDPGAVRDVYGFRYDELHAAISGYLDDFGETAFAQRLLEDGLELEFGAADRREAVRLSLDLNYDQANQNHPNVGERDAVNVRTGVSWANPVESPHESTAAGVGSIGSDRTTSGSANVTFGFGAVPVHGPNRVVTAQFTGTAAASSSGTHTFGETATSATRRLFETSGRTAFFDFPQSTLRAEVRQAAAPAAQAGWEHRMDVRFGFPEDLSPLRSADAAPGVLAEERMGAGLPRLGVDPARLAAEEEVDGPLHAAAVRVAAVPHEFFVVPESIMGLRPLREDVIAALGGARADHALLEHVHFQLGERSALEMLNDMAGPGWTSPPLVGADGRQLRMTTTAQLRDAVPLGVSDVPLREESQRFVNFSAGSTVGDSATGTSGAMLSHAFGDLSAPLGVGGVVSASGSWAARMSSGHSTSANLGSAHWSGLVYTGGSVLYRATYHMAVRLESADRPSDTVGRDVTVYLRLPEHQQARFEAMLEDQAGQTPAGRESYPEDVDDRPVDANFTQEQREAEQRERSRVRHPPLTLAAGRGIGPSAISHLAGSEKVLPQLVEFALRASTDTLWHLPWDRLELDRLRTELASRYTPEGLINWGSALFQDGGVRMEFTRPAAGGSEVITFTVRGVLQDPEGSIDARPRPAHAGRISNARLDFMPIGFSGHSASDAVGRGSTRFGQITGAAGIGTGTAARTVGGAGGYQRVQDTTDTVAVNPTTFLISAVLHDGPLRYFDYRVAYDVEVSSRHESGYNVVDHVKAAPALASGLLSGRSVADQTATPVLRRVIGDGRARFVTIEKLAPTEAVTPAAANNVGVLRELAFPAAQVRQRVRSTHAGGATLPPPVTAPAQGSALPPEVTVVVPPAVEPHLGRGGHVPLHADDQVTEVLGGAGMADVLVRLLDGLHVPRETYGQTPWMLTSTENLTASQVRGPSEIRHTLFVGGELGDRRVVITLTGFPHNVQQGTEDVPILRMNVAEAGGAVSSTTSRTVTDSIRGVFNLGLVDHHSGSGTETTTPSFSASRNTRYETVSSGTSFNPVTGRLIQSRRPHRVHNGDMLWRMSVVVYRENTILNGEPMQAHALVDMSRGISFLRLTDPLPDPRLPGILRTLPRPDLVPADVPDRLTLVAQPQDAGLHDGSLAVSTMPATPGSTVRVPRVPLVPAGAVSERLMAPRPTRPAHDVTGEGNPLYDAARRLVAEHAENFVDHYWTVEDVAGGDLVRHLPASLRSLLDPSSQEALLDQMLGSGLRLTATGQSALGAGTQRLQLLIRATRSGEYRLAEYLGDAVIARYHFRYHSTSDASAYSPGYSGGLAGAPIFRDAPSEPGRFASANIGGGATVASSVTRGHALTRTEAVRETPFTRGSAARYVGDISINVSLTRTWIPARALVAGGYGVARDLAGLMPGVGDRALARPSVDVTMHERVVIPLGLLRDDTPRPAAAPALAAVTPVSTEATAETLGATPLRITADELRSHDAYVISADPAKIRILSDAVVDRFSGAVAPNGGVQRAAVAQLFEEGTLSENAARTLMSHPMFTRQLDLMLTDSGFTSPVLVREGGIADTHGRITIRVELLNPHMRGYTAGSHETVDYGFRQYDGSFSADSTRNINVSPGTAEALGELGSNLPPNSLRHETLNDSLSTTLGQSAGSSGTGTLRAMPRQRSRNRDGQWLIVDADMRVHVEVTAESKGVIGTPGGTAATSFVVRDGVQLALSPESALEHGLVHPGGLTVPTGVFVAARGSRYAPDSIVRDIHETYGLRGVNPARHFVVNVSLTPGGFFVVGDRRLTASEFHKQVLARRALAGRTLVLVAPRADFVDADPTRGTRQSPAEELARLTRRPVLATEANVGWTRDGTLRTFAEGPRPMGPFEDEAQWGLLTPIRGGVERSPHGNVLEDALVSADAHQQVVRPPRPVSDHQDSATRRSQSPTESTSPPPSRRGSRRSSLALEAIAEGVGALSEDAGADQPTASEPSERARGKRRAEPEDAADGQEETVLRDEDVLEEFFEAEGAYLDARDTPDRVRSLDRPGPSRLPRLIAAAESAFASARTRYERAEAEMLRRGLSTDLATDLANGRPQPTSGRIPLVEGDAGAAGFEAELHDFQVVLPHGIEASDYDTVVASPNLQIVLDDGTGVPLLEVVSRPARVLAGAADDGRADRAHVMAELRDVLRRLGDALDNQPLESVFPAQAGYSVTAEAEGIRVRRPERSTGRLYVHYTLGIPVSGLGGFLTHVQGRVREVGIGGPARLHLADALRFGADARSLFAGWLADNPDLTAGVRAEDHQAVEGFLAHAYDQVAAAAQGAVSPGMMVKSFAAAASRMSLVAVRAELSPVVQEFLEFHADDLTADFARAFSDHVSDTEFVEGILGRRLGARWPRDAERPTATVGEYLDNALRRDPAVPLSQSQVLGVRTDFDELDANPENGVPRLDPPLVLLELRTFGSYGPRLAEFQSEYAGLEARALQAYNDARDLRGNPLVGRTRAGGSQAQSQRFVERSAEERLTRAVNRTLGAAGYRPLTWPEIEPYDNEVLASDGLLDVPDRAAQIAAMLMSGQRGRLQAAEEQRAEGSGAGPSHVGAAGAVSAGAGVDGLAWWRPKGEPSAAFAQRYGWLAQVNDSEDRLSRGLSESATADGGGWLLNCALTAIATHMSIADAEAGPFVAPPVDAEAPSGLPLKDLENYANDSRGPVAAGVAPRVLTRAAGFAEIAEAVERAGEGAHGFVVVSAARDKTAHVFNVVHDADGVVFLDGQTGRQAELPDDGADIFFIPVGRTGIDLRVTDSKATFRMVEPMAAPIPIRVGRSVPQRLTSRTAARNVPASATVKGADTLHFAADAASDLGQDTAESALPPRFAGAPAGVGWVHALWAQSWGLRFDPSVGSLYDALLAAGGGSLAVRERVIGDADMLRRTLGSRIGEAAPGDDDLSRAAAHLGVSLLILRENGSMSSHGWGPALVVAEAVGGREEPAWAGLPAAVGDASLLGGLSGAQLRWAADARMRFVARPGGELGGDLFGALIAADRATAAPALDGEQADLRGRLVRWLRTGAQSANEAWDALVADGRVPRGDSAEVRERFAASVQQGRNDDAVSALLPPLASRLFGVAVRVVDPDGATRTDGDSGAASVLTLARTEAEGSSFDAAPVWVPLAGVRPAQVSGAGTRPADVPGGRGAPDSAAAVAATGPAASTSTAASTSATDTEDGLDPAGASGAQWEWARDNGRRLVEVPDGLSAAILRSVGGAVFVRGVYVEDPARLRELIAEDVRTAQHEDPGLSLVAHTVYAGLDGGETAPSPTPRASSDERINTRIDTRINSGRALAEMIDAIATPGARPELADELLPFFANRLGLGVRVVDPSGVVGRYGRGRPAYIAWSADADGTRRWMAAPRLPSRYALRSPLRAPNLSDPVLVQLAGAVDARRGTLRADGAHPAADGVIVGLRDARNAWLANGVRSRRATADASAPAAAQWSAQLVQDTVARVLQATEAANAPETGGALGTGVALSRAIGLLGALFPMEQGEIDLGPAAVEEAGPARDDVSAVGIPADEWIAATLPDLVGVLPVGGAALFLGGRTLALVDTDAGHRLVDFGLDLDQVGHEATGRVLIPSTASMAAVGSGLALVMDSAGRTVRAQDLSTEFGQPLASAVGWSTEPGAVTEQDVPAATADGGLLPIGLSSRQAAWALERGVRIDDVESGPNGLFNALLQANGGRFAARGADSADAEQVEDATRLRRDVAGHLRERASAPGALRGLPSIAAAFAFEGAERIVEEYFDQHAAAADLRALDRQLDEHIETGKAVEFIAKAVEEPGHWERITRWPALDALADWAGVTIFVVGHDGGVHQHGELTDRRLAVASVDTELTDPPGWAALVPRHTGGDATEAVPSGFEDVTADTVSSLTRSTPAAESAAELGERQLAAVAQHGLTVMPTATGSMFDAFLSAAGGAIQIGRDALISTSAQLRQTLADLLRDRPDVLAPATRQRVERDMRDAGLIDGRADARIVAGNIDEELRDALDDPATLGAEAYAPHLFGAYLGVEVNILGSDGEISTYGTGRPVYIAAASSDGQAGEERWSALVAPPRTPEVERSAEEMPDDRAEESAQEPAERAAPADLGEIAQTPWHPDEFTLVQPTEERVDDAWRSSTFCVANTEGQLACVNAAVFVLDHQLARYLGLAIDEEVEP